MENILATATLITYGDGEKIAGVLNAVAMIMNSNGTDNFVRPLAMLCAFICGAFGISKALFSGSMESLLSKYLFPILIISTFFMVPTTTVRVEDLLIRANSRTVDNVPLLLGRFAALTSTASYHITRSLESVFHLTNDSIGEHKLSDYEETGMIFGAGAAVDLTLFKITDAELEKNLRNFSKQCVLYDIALGRYSINSLKKSTDLWDFFEANTSNVRMIPYCSSDTSNQTQKVKCEYKTCKEAITEMRKKLSSEVAYYEKADMLKGLPVAFQAFTGMANASKENILGQQMMMQMLSSEFNGSSFAKIRADNYQKSYMNTLGSLAAKTIIGTRSAVEGVIYGSFVLILPFSLLPGGLTFISRWMWFVIWIQMWPPFFVIINYIMLLVAEAKVQTLSGIGLSFYTNVGIQDIQDQVLAMAGYLSANVPFITYTFLHGGINAVGSLSSAIMSPLTSAASIAAGEETSGNYSFGNVSTGNMSHHNDNAFQTNSAPSLRSQVITANNGVDSTTFGYNDQIHSQGRSDLGMGFAYDETNSASMSSAIAQSQAMTASKESAYTTAASSHVRNTANLVETLSKSENYNSGTSQGTSFGIQKDASEAISIAERYGSSMGMNTRDSLETLASVSGGYGLPHWFPMFNLAANGSLSSTTSDDATKALSAAQDAVRSSDFKTHLQKIQNFAENSGATSLIDEAKRTAHDYSESCDMVKSSQEAYRAALSTTNQLTENAAWLENTSQHVTYKQTEEFSKWINDTGAMRFSEFERVTNSGSDEERVWLLNKYAEFNREMHPSLLREPSIEGFAPLEDMYNGAKNEMPNINYDDEKQRVSEAYTKFNNDAELTPGEVSRKRDELDHLYNRKGDHDIENKLVLREHNLDVSLKEIRNPIINESNKLLAIRKVGHVLDDAVSVVGNVVSGGVEAGSIVSLWSDKYSQYSDQNENKNSFNIKSKPFWLKEAD